MVTSEHVYQLCRSLDYIVPFTEYILVDPLAETGNNIISSVKRNIIEQVYVKRGLWQDLILVKME